MWDHTQSTIVVVDDELADIFARETFTSEDLRRIYLRLSASIVESRKAAAVYDRVTRELFKEHEVRYSDLMKAITELRDDLDLLRVRVVMRNPLYRRRLKFR